MAERLLKFIKPEILNSKTLTNVDKYKERRNKSRRAGRKLGKTLQQRTKSTLDGAHMLVEALGSLTKLSLHFTQFQMDFVVEKEGNEDYPGATGRIRLLNKEDGFLGDRIRKIPKRSPNNDVETKIEDGL
jgi:hypothetical protein